VRAASSSSDRPNILLVVLDTARADHFGPWGDRARTPVFDQLASHGVAVPHARSAAPWTVPSHASLFTGLRPFEHGVTGLAAYADGRVVSLGPAIAHNADRWLPAAMQAAGYRTFGVSANVWITPPMGFDLGFDSFHPVGPAKIRPRGGETVARRRWIHRIPAPIRAGIKGPVRQMQEARNGRDFGSIQAVAAITAEATRGNAPFFGFVNIIEPHAPYLPPGGCNPLRGVRRLQGPKLVRRYLMNAHAVAYNAGAAEIPDEALVTFRELYAGEIAYSDRLLGRMLESLEANHVLDDTLIVVTSDHGENLGEDHLIGHQASLDDRLLHVPLVFAGPGMSEAPSGSVVFPMTGVPWVLARVAGLEGRWEAPDGMAVSQYEPGIGGALKLQAAADRFDITETQWLRLRRSIEQATDGVTTVTVDSLGTERVEGPESGAMALRLAIQAARGDRREPPVDARGELPTLEQQTEIEHHLADLGYI
jgi:arylsulfatase A-like enzyme